MYEQTLRVVYCQHRVPNCEKCVVWCVCVCVCVCGMREWACVAQHVRTNTEGRVLPTQSTQL